MGGVGMSRVLSGVRCDSLRMTIQQTAMTRLALSLRFLHPGSGRFEFERDVQRAPVSPRPDWEKPISAQIRGWHSTPNSQDHKGSFTTRFLTASTSPSMQRGHSKMDTVGFEGLGGDIVIQDHCVVGLKYKSECASVVFHGKAMVRSGTVIYADVEIGEFFQTGHNVLVRESTKIGRHVVIGTNTVIDGQVQIGDFVKIETNCYIPTHVSIGSRVFLGPGAVLTNDKYPLKMRDTYSPEGPTIEDCVTIGAGAVVLPGIRIGRNSFVAAGAVVTRDVPPDTFVVGVPGREHNLPAGLNEENMALSWRGYLDEQD